MRRRSDDAGDVARYGGSVLEEGASAISDMVHARDLRGLSSCVRVDACLMFEGACFRLTRPSLGVRVVLEIGWRRLLEGLARRLDDRPRRLCSGDDGEGALTSKSNDLFVLGDGGPAIETVPRVTGVGECAFGLDSDDRRPVGDVEEEGWGNSKRGLSFVGVSLPRLVQRSIVQS